MTQLKRNEIRIKTNNSVVVESCFLSEAVDAGEEHTHGEEPFKSTIKWLLFSAIFGVNCFEECFCWSQGHHLKPINVKVALPHYPFLLICNMHILCAADPMSLNCISFILVEARYFLHMNKYLVYMLWMSMFDKLLFCHAVVMFCHHSIPALGRCSRNAWNCLILVCLINCSYASWGCSRKHGKSLLCATLTSCMENFQAEKTSHGKP